MDRAERRARLQQLLDERKAAEEAAHKKQQIEEIYALFSDSDLIVIQNEEESDRIEQDMTECFPIASYGRIDWHQIQHQMDVSEIPIEDIPKIIAKINLPNTLPVYLNTGIYKYPVIETSLSSIMNNHKEIIIGGYEQWVYCSVGQYVIEFYNGAVKIGWHKS